MKDPSFKAQLKDVCVKEDGAQEVVKYGGVVLLLNSRHSWNAVQMSKRSTNRSWSTPSLGIDHIIIRNKLGSQQSEGILFRGGNIRLLRFFAKTHSLSLSWNGLQLTIAYVCYNRVNNWMMQGIWKFSTIQCWRALYLPALKLPTSALSCLPSSWRRAMTFNLFYQGGGRDMNLPMAEYISSAFPNDLNLE